MQGQLRGLIGIALLVIVLLLVMLISAGTDSSLWCFKSVFVVSIGVYPLKRKKKKKLV